MGADRITTIYCGCKNSKFFARCNFTYNRKKHRHPTPNRSNVGHLQRITAAPIRSNGSPTATPARDHLHPRPNTSNGSRAAARRSPTNPERPFENRKPPRFLQKILQKPRRYFVRPPADPFTAGVGIVDSRLIVVSRRSRPSRRVVRNVCGSSRRRSRRGFGWE